MIDYQLLQRRIDAMKLERKLLKRAIKRTKKDLKIIKKSDQDQQ